MTSWSTTNRTSTSWGTQAKSGEVIYLVSDATDYYLVGSAEDEFLVTQDQTSWTASNKSS